MIRQRLVAGFVTATALVTLAACGSSSKSSSTTAAAATTTEAVADTTGVTTGTGSDATDVSTDVSTPDLSIPDVSVPDISTPELTGECVALQQDLPDISNATELNAADIKKAFDTLRSRVPSDLKDDIDTFQTTFQPFYDAVAKAGGDTTKALQDPQLMQEMQKAITDPKFTSATQALDDWFSKGCPS